MLTLWRAGKAFYGRLGRDEVSAYAAALTYNLLFALFPLALVLAAVVPALHLTGAQHGFLKALEGVVPAQVVRLASPQRPGLPSVTVAYAGGSGYVLGMSAAFRRLMEAFDRAYEDRGPSRRAAWWRIALSVILALTLGVLLIAGMVMATLGQRLTAALWPHAGVLQTLAGWLRWLVPAAMALGMLAALYWIAPDRRRPFRALSLGAVTAIGVWFVVSYGFSIYLSHFNAYNLIYGSVGTLILLLLYLYFVSYALLLGAEINAVVEAAAAGDRVRRPEGGSRSARRTDARDRGPAAGPPDGRRP